MRAACSTCYGYPVLLALLACASPDALWPWSKPTNPTITRDDAAVDTADSGNVDTGDTSDTASTDTGDSSLDSSDTGADTGDTSIVDTSDTGAADTSDTSDTGATDTADTSDTSTTDTSDTGASDTSDTSTTDTSDTGGSVTYTVAPDAPTDWVLEDLNPGSYRFGEPISPRDYISRVSGYYFTHST